MRIPNTALLFFLSLTLPVSANSRIEPTASPQVIESKSAQDKAPRKSLALPAPSRGQLLYENHCMTCHESVVHIRTRQQTQSLLELRNQVTRWAAYSKLRWSKDEIEDVTHYLNARFYKFNK